MRDRPCARRRRDGRAACWTICTRGRWTLPVLVVDDGSRDATAETSRARAARRCSCTSATSARGPRSVTGLVEAARARVRRRGDGRRRRPAPGASARVVLHASDDRRALVLGVRDLAATAHREQPLLERRVATSSSRSSRGARSRHPVRPAPLPGRRDARLGRARARLRLRGRDAPPRPRARGSRCVEVPVRVVYPPRGRARDALRQRARSGAHRATVVLRTARPRLRGGLRP